MIYLISRDSKKKLRVVETECEFIESEYKYIIHRTTYQYGGKKTEQPDKIIEHGKAKRTVKEQADLEFAHIIKEYCDKGYKQLKKPIFEYTEKELNDIVGEEITGSNGVPKVMLAKQADKVTNKAVFDKEYYASRKIDGLRCAIYLGEDGELHTQSRGSMNYDASMCQILNNPTLIKLFKQNPWLIMDGECYKHGMTLQQINSVARTQVTANDYSILQFYWYDIYDSNRSFKERYKRMLAIKNALQLGFDPEREFKDGELRIQFVPQESISGWDKMQELHNQYVSEGWEGLVIRNVDATYGPNKRTNDMIKIKMYRDKEFKIVGYELGLRGTEDMVFWCETENGIKFKAKPHGDRALKQKYIDEFDTMCLDKMAVVKFFYYSDDGVPLQPSVKCIRLEEDI